MNKAHKFKQTEIGLIPEDWEVKDVNHFCSKITSGGTPSRKKKSYWENGKILWLKTKELLDNDIYTAEEMITEDGLKKSSAKLFPKETVIMAMYGATVGKLGISQIELTTNQACCAMIIDSEKSVPRFLFYELLQNRNKLINLSTGAAQQNLNQDTIRNFKLPFPSLSEQSAIAKILSDLDSKIELLGKQNETLEKIGQAIFKHWFVGFEFPNEEGKPYKSSGEKMVESELGEIPEGWSVGKLGDIASFKNGINYSRDTTGDSEFKIVNVRNAVASKYINEDSLDSISIDRKKAEPYLLKKDSILIVRSASPGEITFIKDSKNEIIYSGFIIKCEVNNQNLKNYTLQFLENRIKYLLSFSDGTTLKNINQQALNNFDILIPDDKILKIYDSFIDVVFNKIFKNKSEILSLQKTRNLLLPKLMTGKIRVPLEVEG